MKFTPGYRGFVEFTRAIGIELAPFQKVIARAAFGPERELAVVIPRGNAKTTTAALLALHHVLVVADASVSLGAASREQASIAFECMKRAAEHPALADLVTVRHLAIRAERGGRLRVLSGKGERAHGQTDSLAIGDEVWAWRDDSLLEAFESGLVKRADARLILISTAAPTLDSPLGRLRQRALAGESTRRGAFTDARAPGLRWLEWSLPEDRSLSTLREVKRANPAPWITAAALAEQRERVTPQAFAQLHACRWGVSEAAWLPPGAWSACRGEYEVEPGAVVVLGVDVGGSRAASAVVAVDEQLRVAAVEVFQGNDSVLDVTEAVRRLAARFTVREVAFDPWRWKSEALRLEAEGIGAMVEFPQSSARMIPASERLHAAIVEQRLSHPGDPELDRHVAAAVAKATGRGWRLDKSDHAAQIDAVVALCMAVERVGHRPAPVRVLAWV